MTASWQDPNMGAHFHERFGGSPKHDAVPDEYEAGWQDGRQALLEELADAMDELEATKNLPVGDPRVAMCERTRWLPLSWLVDDPVDFAETLRKWAKEVGR